MLEYLPPRDERGVTISGYAVPRIEAQEINEGRDCSIVLDRRFGITVPADMAEQVIWLLANALAIGGGYSCHGENSQPMNPYRVQVLGVDSR